MSNKIISKQEFLENLELFSLKMLSGAIFIYPTDTIYGIGCNALNTDSVKQIRVIKKSYDNPFSVIAPSKDWIKDNLILTSATWLDKLPGAYTLILDLKNDFCISKETNNSKENLGVRIPNNWFSSIVSNLNIPVITTSVNLHSMSPITRISQVPQSIKEKIDFIIDDGILTGNPSTIINLTKKNPEILERVRK